MEEPPLLPQHWCKWNHEFFIMEEPEAYVVYVVTWHVFWGCWFPLVSRHVTKCWQRVHQPEAFAETVRQEGGCRSCWFAEEEPCKEIT
jgi:hypothetical protein